jgi:hypothetical protein
MKVGWYFHRLRAMTIAELAHRVAERWKHRSDASFGEAIRGMELGDAVADSISLPRPEAAPPNLKETLATDAARLMSGRWELFGWREVQVGTPPQWHRDAASGAEVKPDGLAHQLNHRALPDGADARTIWEINRWSEMVRLGMHARINGDVEALRAAIAWLEDWCDRNPVGRGINWTSPLEAGLRLINFAWFDALVHDSSCATDQLKLAQQHLARRIVPAHAAWVWRYRSFGSSANNHLLGELVGLLHAVKRWPALEKEIVTAESLWDQIARCVLEQFAEDGGNKEQALHYHLFAWEMAWHAARLMRVTEGPVMERLRKAAEFFVQVAHEGEQWEYGDNDDAQIVPLTLHRERAVAEWRAWMCGAAGDSAHSETLGYWLGGLPVRGGRPVEGWWHAPESGMIVCQRDGWKLRIDASPLGFGAMAAHGHCDALHVSIWDGPHALVIDPGTGGYYGMKDLRAALAAWDVHNGPEPLAGFRTPKRMGAFLWQEAHETPQVELRSHEVGLSLQHEGRHSPRTVSYDEARKCICVFDCGTPEFIPHAQGSDGVVSAVTQPSRDEVKFRSRWHLAPECSVDDFDAAQGTVRFSRDGRRWRMSVAAPMGTFEIKLASSVASRAYGKTERCTVVEVIGDDCVRLEWHRDA